MIKIQVKFYQPINGINIDRIIKNELISLLSSWIDKNNIDGHLDSQTYNNQIIGLGGQNSNPPQYSHFGSLQTVTHNFDRRQPLDEQKYIPPQYSRFGILQTVTLIMNKSFPRDLFEVSSNISNFNFNNRDSIDDLKRSLNEYEETFKNYGLSLHNFYRILNNNSKPPPNLVLQDYGLYKKTIDQEIKIDKSQPYIDENPQSLYQGHNVDDYFQGGLRRVPVLSKSPNLTTEESIRAVVTSSFEEAKEQLVKKLLALMVEDNGPKCNGCKKALSGVHYSCTECPEYYLCICCEENEVHPHGMLKKRHLA